MGRPGRTDMVTLYIGNRNYSSWSLRGWLATKLSGVPFDPEDSGERARAEGLARRISLRAIAMGGTCTGEHGIGVHKLEALVAEHGEAVDLMRTIKRALDPRNIMNPGKTVPL